MKPIYCILAAVSVAFGAPAPAVPPVGPSSWAGSCDVAFYGTSTLHDFDGSVKAVPLVIKVESGSDGPVVSSAPVVAVADMTTRNKERDEKMRAMFQASVSPQLALEVLKAPLAKARPTPAGPGRIPVKLTIAGVAKTLDGEVTELQEKADSVSFTLAFPVSLSAFRLSPPSVLGLVRVADQVRVKAWVSLKRRK